MAHKVSAFQSHDGQLYSTEREAVAADIAHYTPLPTSPGFSVDGGDIKPFYEVAKSIVDNWYDLRKLMLDYEKSDRSYLQLNHVLDIPSRADNGLTVDYTPEDQDDYEAGQPKAPTPPYSPPKDPGPSAVEKAQREADSYQGNR